MLRWAAVTLGFLMLGAMVQAGPHAIVATLALLVAMMQRDKRTPGVARLQSTLVVAALAVTIAGVPWSTEKRRLRAGKPDEPTVVAAAHATEAFRHAVSEGRFADACGSAEPNAFHEETELDCERFLAELRDRTGNYERTTRQAAFVKEWAPREWAFIRSAARFERMEGEEIFRWRLSGGGEARLLAYESTYWRTRR